jgi:putative transposase
MASLGRPVGRDDGQRCQRLKELEVENTRLKKLLAEAELDKAMLKEIAEGNF